MAGFVEGKNEAVVVSGFYLSRDAADRLGMTMEEFNWLARSLNKYFLNGGGPPVFKEHELEQARKWLRWRAALIGLGLRQAHLGFRFYEHEMQGALSADFFDCPASVHQGVYDSAVLVGDRVWCEECGKEIPVVTLSRSKLIDAVKNARERGDSVLEIYASRGDDDEYTVSVQSGNTVGNVPDGSFWTNYWVSSIDEYSKDWHDLMHFDEWFLGDTRDFQTMPFVLLVEDDVDEGE